ncbi:MAG: hypothetical protein Kow00103_11870 [Candidatus Caldatribacteriota bacterium]
MARQYCVVCGEDVKKEKYVTEYDGVEYYFCSAECLEEFENNPEEYVETNDEDWN